MSVHWLRRIPRSHILVLERDGPLDAANFRSGEVDLEDRVVRHRRMRHRQSNQDRATGSESREAFHVARALHDLDLATPTPRPFRDVFPPKLREEVRTDTWSDRGAVLVKEGSRVYLETPGIIS